MTEPHTVDRTVRDGEGSWRRIRWEPDGSHRQTGERDAREPTTPVPAKGSVEGASAPATV
ncbi:hypothetical protein ABZY45_10940 [Streptomyces sp. NPDC006516]|uniref:hypothetical protein n=1 Tax=Streptomyces sp. NPDC006516 TaxID=3154309 RepID=UPI0033B3FDA3